MTDERDEPGAYDVLARLVLRTVNAEAVFVLVVNGTLGSGASSAAISPAAQLQLADLQKRLGMEGLAAFQEKHARDILGRG